MQFRVESGINGDISGHMGFAYIEYCLYRGMQQEENMPLPQERAFWFSEALGAGAHSNKKQLRPKCLKTDDVVHSLLPTLKP